MTLLADFLRDNHGEVVRIYPDALGELNLTRQQLVDGWTIPTFTVPTEGFEYRTLADSAGTTWYVYVIRVEAGDEIHHEIEISTVLPTAQPTGIWRDPEYGLNLVATDAVIGSEIYLAFKDVSSTDWYVYPNVLGELVISTTMPV